MCVGFDMTWTRLVWIAVLAIFGGVFWGCSDTSSKIFISATATPTVTTPITVLAPHTESHSPSADVYSISNLYGEGFTIVRRLAQAEGNPLPCTQKCNEDTIPELVWGGITTRCEKAVGLDLSGTSLPDDSPHRRLYGTLMKVCAEVSAELLQFGVPSDDSTWQARAHLHRQELDEAMMASAAELDRTGGTR